MAETECLTVRAAGRQLDELRSEASRIAKGSKVDWWVERTGKGTTFCFEGSGLRSRLAAFCDNFGVPHQDG